MRQDCVVAKLGDWDLGMIRMYHLLWSQQIMKFLSGHL